jgi:nitrogen regulatory protein P-II 1
MPQRLFSNRPFYAQYAAAMSRAVAKGSHYMKKLEAIIEPFQLAAVKEALLSIGIDGMTISEVHLYGSQNGSKVVYRGQRLNVDLLPKVRFDVVVPDERVGEAVDAIAGVAPAGSVAYNRILVYAVAEAVAVHTGMLNASGDHRTAA